jgi:hypothetical protein
MADNTHPWIAVAEVLGPQPGPNVVRFDPVNIMDPQGETQGAAMLTVATTSGVMNVFLGKKELENVIANAQTVFDGISEIVLSREMPKGAPVDLSKIRGGL